MSRTSITGHVLADLVAEFVKPPVETLTKLRGMEGKSVGVVSALKPPCWKVYVDGAANQRGSGVGLVLITPERATIEKSLRLGFLATNNEEAEYKALLQGMAMVQKMGGKVVKMFSDSRLIVGQVKGDKRYLLVGTDYFTKWVEAEPLANIRDANAKRFV